MVHIKTSYIDDIKPFLKRLVFPKPESHKGQNGKVLVVGGSKLFHSASIWAAEIASYFVDIVHYSSIKENNTVFLSLKKKFQNGIIVSHKDLPQYAKEDDAILIGPGMIRGAKNPKSPMQTFSFDEILRMKEESSFTYHITEYFIKTFPQKKFVFDAGALQMMDPSWFGKLEAHPIITPHQGEFYQLFGEEIASKQETEKITMVREYAKKFQVVILLKAVHDIISDGEEVIVVEGGNAGLTKGGSGDVLAGLTLSFLAKNDPLVSAVVSSYLLKRSADMLGVKQGYWYNMATLIDAIPQTFLHMVS